MRAALVLCLALASVSACGIKGDPVPAPRLDQGALGDWIDGDADERGVLE